MDYSKITLGELLSSNNETIRRNAISILKEMQRGQTIIEMNEYANGASVQDIIYKHDK